jgi:hypothetical protein
MKKSFFEGIMLKCKKIIFSILMLCMFVSCSNRESRQDPYENDVYNSREFQEYGDEAYEQTIKNVSRTIADNVDSLRSCYLKEMRSSKKKKNKNLKSGEIKMYFTLTKKGKPQRVGVGEGNMSIQLKACLVSAIWAMPFEKPLTNKAVKIIQPLSF